MTKAFRVGSPQFADDLDEDTIELELSPSDLLALSRPLEVRHAAVPPVDIRPTAAEPTFAQPPSAQQPSAEATWAEPASADESSFAGDAPRMNRWPLARITGVLGIAAAVIALGSAAHRPAARAPSPPAVALKTPSSAPPAAPAAAESAGPPVRFKNPFDPSEVFEFPPGTSKAEARQWVANVLLERARDRHPQLKSTKRVGGIRAARGRSAERTDLAANTARAAR
jgi:hypothetical protein